MNTTLEEARQTAGPFTPKEFREESLRFRELMVQKTFWAKPQKDRQAALNGLGFMYLHTEEGTAEEMEAVANLFQMNLNEYTRREVLAIQYGMAGKEE